MNISIPISSIQIHKKRRKKNKLARSKIVWICDCHNQRQQMLVTQYIYMLHSIRFFFFDYAFGTDQTKPYGIKIKYSEWVLKNQKHKIRKRWKIKAFSTNIAWNEASRTIEPQKKETFRKKNHLKKKEFMWPSEKKKWGINCVMLKVSV